MGPPQEISKLNFSFSGAGFLGIYHFGVAACLQEHVPHLLNKISGASAGALAACTVLTGVPIRDAVDIWLQASTTTRCKVIGAMSPSSDVSGIVRYGLEQCLPVDAHLLVNGRIHISLTRVRDMKNIIYSQFNSRAELIDALVCAVTIPFFVGLIPPAFRGERYIDGGYTNNLLIHDEHTVTVTPFCGISNICPQDGPALSPWTFMANNTSIELSAKNLIRAVQMIHPPHPDTLAKICNQGYLDAMKYLTHRELVGCRACILTKLDNTTTHLVKESSFQNSTVAVVPSDDECLECEAAQKCSKNSKLPNTIQSLFNRAINADAQTLEAKLRQYKIIKLFSILTLPTAIYFDLIYAAAIKLKRFPELMNRQYPRVPNSRSTLLHNSIISLH